MRILHYSLGFPPYRTGGLTKFCYDLMLQQSEEGNEVYLLWPGSMPGRKIHIRRKKNRMDGIVSYELINPLPVPYDEGIIDVDAFMEYGDKQVFKDFLNQLKPDVIHIHTFMGLYASFLDAANEENIRTVFTTHDFFPFCPKVTLFRGGEICDSFRLCNKCPECNLSALSLNKIRILQSPLYRMAKDTRVMKRIRKRHRREFLNEVSDLAVIPSVSDNAYRKLRNYYQDIFRKINLVHFNSEISRKIYTSVFGEKEYRVIPITHRQISDHKTRKSFTDQYLKIRYLGPQGGYKGFHILKKGLDRLWEERKNFQLDIHFEPLEVSPYMRIHDRYDYADLEMIFRDTDLLAAPSKWYETFGYTVLEALSYGVPVLISGTVGAKDILTEGGGIVIEDITPEKIYYAINSINAEGLQAMNERIVTDQHIMSIYDMSAKIMSDCYLEGE